MTKQEIHELVDQLPEKVDAEELMYRPYLKAKIERAEADIEAGNLISHEEVVRESEKWFE